MYHLVKCTLALCIAATCIMQHTTTVTLMKHIQCTHNLSKTQNTLKTLKYLTLNALFFLRRTPAKK